MSSRTIPPLLEPYTRLPPSSSLTLLTSVLSASTNWLVLRYLYAALATTGAPEAEKQLNDGDNTLDGGADVSVVLVSFLRDAEFWREGARRMGLDLRRLAVQGRFAFVDGLTGLFTPPASSVPSASSPSGVSSPVRGAAAAAGAGAGAGAGVLPPRGAPGGIPPAQAAATPASIPQTTILNSPALENVRETISSQIRRVGTVPVSSPASHAVSSGLPTRNTGVAGSARAAAVQQQQQQQQKRRVLLIVDQPDLLLATTGVDATDMVTWLFNLREQVHSTVVTIAADAPLVQSPTTPLEQAHASFLLSLAHQARLTVSLRLLDTGTAKDVSGVIQFTKGPDEFDDGAEDEGLEERELLYFVVPDGSVKVFERGT